MSFCPTELLFAGLSLAFFLHGEAYAQGSSGPATVHITAADYAKAEKFLGYNTNPLVFHSDVRPTWLSADRFWYRNATPAGTEFILVDLAQGTRTTAFDRVKLAETLSRAAGKHYDPKNLPISELEMSSDNSTFSVTLGGQAWNCDRGATSCASGKHNADGKTPGESGEHSDSTRNQVLSPDKKHSAFIRNYNLWVRDTNTGAEKQLTTDGVEDFGYATDNAGWRRSDRSILLWSADSRKIATFQQDQRAVGQMFLVDTRIGHPHLEAWRYPLPGDETVTTIQRIVIDLDAGKIVRLRMPPDQHRSTLCDDIACRDGEWSDVQWSSDGSQLAFVSTSRDHKHEQLRVADPNSGKVRDVLEESVATYFESGNGRINWRFLPSSREIIWFSERDNWGHLYLYDLESGRLKQQITKGDWNVTQLLRVDEKNRTIYFLGVGRESGRDPYFSYLYSIGFDGSNLSLLTPEDANHQVSLSPSGLFFVDSFSTPEVPPAALVRDATGKLVTRLEKADISKLLSNGWKPPVPFKVKARDGKTDLYGLMFKPTDFDPARKYPVVNHIYPGPQTGSVGSRSFSAARGDAQSLAELGFIVVELDGMGTPWRSKSFHDAVGPDLSDNTLPDQVIGMKQLAHEYSWIDLDRAGICGHSGGGYAAADAMFRYPDFFKVGVSEAGNHDNRDYEDDWAEKWQGLLRKEKDGKTNYDNQANETFAKNLKGHLLLAHGTMDSNVPPYNTLLVVDELIKANKDFDLIMLPNRKHGFGNEPYMIRRRWDYFVRYLLGSEPPKEYELHPSPDPASMRP